MVSNTVEYTMRYHPTYRTLFQYWPWGYYPHGAVLHDNLKRRCVGVCVCVYHLTFRGNAVLALVAQTQLLQGIHMAMALRQCRSTHVRVIWDGGTNAQGMHAITTGKAIQ